MSRSFPSESQPTFTLDPEQPSRDGPEPDSSVPDEAPEPNEPPLEVLERHAEPAQEEERRADEIAPAPAEWNELTEMIDVQLEQRDGDPLPNAGAALLDRVAAWICRYVWLPSPAADAIALWMVLTWCVEKLELAPILSVLSATKQCGKTTLLDLLSCLVRIPAPTSGPGITEAVFFRYNDAKRPTFLIDEAEKLGGSQANRRMIGHLNAGYRRGSFTMRCFEEKGGYGVKRFDVFGFRALFAIGDLWDTILDRSIVVRLERKPRDAQVERFRIRSVQRQAQRLAAGIEQWVETNCDRIAEVEKSVKMSDLPTDRAYDNWSGLFAVAQVGGGDWPDRAEKAAQSLTARRQKDTDPAEALIQDLYTIFQARGWPEAIGSSDLETELNRLEESSWAEYRAGRGITVQWLAKKLRAFGVAPRQAYLDGEKLRRYYRSDLRDVFERYVGPVEPGQPGYDCDDGADRQPGCEMGAGTDPGAADDSHGRRSNRDAGSSDSTGPIPAIPVPADPAVS